MQVPKRIFFGMLALTIFLGSSVATYAQTNSEALRNVQQELDQKAKEKQSIMNDIKNIQQEMESLNTYILKNKDEMEKTKMQIDVTNQRIEEKKEEIVTLEDKILARKGVMKKRLVALQHDNNLNLIIKVFLNAKSFNDLVQRASAVGALFNADKNILDEQQKDLKQIEEDKKEIDSQQKKLQEEQNDLSKQEEQLSLNLQKRQEKLTQMQEKYNQIDHQIANAQKEKASIVAEIRVAQERIRREQEEAKKRSVVGTPVNSASSQVGKGVEMYVTATAYSPEDSGSVTSLGYNIKQNPNLKLIAVDPSVIPLGKKVWVEGYGVAIAGDTGGAIIGHKIDVLMPTKKDALLWGRKTVKIVILE